MSSHKRRKKYLIKPRIQILSALTFLSTAGIYVLLQAILLQGTLRRISEEHPEAAETILPPLLEGMRTNLLLTFAVLVPLTLSIGIMLTFRIAGPIYRFEWFLREIMAGRDPGACRIRKADELHDFCELLNEAVAPLRAANAARLTEAQETSDRTDPEPSGPLPKEEPEGASSSTESPTGASAA